MPGCWYMFVFPGVFLFAFILGWILLGEGLKRIIEKRIEKTEDSALQPDALMDVQQL